MVMWIDIRPDSWPKGIPRHMASTILRRSRSCQDELYQDSVIYCCQLVMTIVPAGCQECLLYKNLQEEVYMEQPPGYAAQGESKVCRLKKIIYRLKQSPRAWFEKFSITIFGIGFRLCRSDHSVFVRRTKSGIVVPTVYVDDILLSRSDSSRIVKTTMYLKRHFVTKDMGYFLRIEVAHQKYNVLLSQRKYARTF